MKVIRAKSAGFCWGVDRAIRIAREFATIKNKTVFTDGPLIHNRQMMETLGAEGIREIGDYQSRDAIQLSETEKANAVMVVRAHGISPERRKYLRELGMDFKDATCPDVGIIAGKIKQHSRKGYATVIFGDPDHPEVIGLMGYSEGKGHVVQNMADVEALPPLGPLVCMVSQSTMFTHEFEALANRLREQYPEAVVIDTICGATKERQG
ncbi:MAG: 4-hydroxy-3-methylbut-2-enyl diphosphate reductase, partial [Opitutales bacterium]|nr:4-hydroxy-3-methylbut-2-enyl diphosphate reductase [Opitutales bacterium]